MPVAFIRPMHNLVLAVAIMPALARAGLIITKTTCLNLQNLLEPGAECHPLPFLPGVSAFRQEQFQELHACGLCILKEVFYPLTPVLHLAGAQPLILRFILAAAWIAQVTWGRI